MILCDIILSFGWLWLCCLVVLVFVGLLVLLDVLVVGVV